MRDGREAIQVRLSKRQTAGERNELRTAIPDSCFSKVIAKYSADFNPNRHWGLEEVGIQPLTPRVMQNYTFEVENLIKLQCNKHILLPLVYDQFTLQPV